MIDNNIIAENLKVFVFSSNINTQVKVDQVREVLLGDEQIYEVDIDLQDIDNVLRVECHPDCPFGRIQELVHQLGFSSSQLA